MTARICKVAILLLFIAFAWPAYGFGIEFPVGHVKALHGPKAVHGHVVRGTEAIYFEADTAALNAHFATMAEKGVKPVVSLHEGKLLARTPWANKGKERSADWMMTTELGSSSPPRVHVFLGGQIDREKIVLPKGVEAIAPEPGVPSASPK
ncbi:MAG TPA: hypothetical protein VGN57_17405 [Pirellulaceae bacterium]|jgi:hypothetical protein|nr:hypothetical protein [Pirellulaceae bacterium]